MVSPRASAPIPSLAEAARYLVRLLQIVRPYWGQLFKGIAFSVVIGIFGMLIPYISKLLIDDVYPAGDIGLMHALVIGILVMTISSSVMGAVQGYYSQVVTAKLGSATSLMFFNHLQHLTSAFFDDHRIGEVMSRFQDVRAALGLISNILQTVFASGVYILLVPPFLLLLNWRLALLSIVVTPVTIAITTLSSRVVRRYYKDNAEANAELNAYQYEVLSHIRTLKPMGIEPQIYAQVELNVRRALQTQLRAGGVSTVIGLANGTLRAAGKGLFMWYAWTLILHHELTLGAFIAFSAYLGYFTGPLNKFASLFSSFQRAAVSLGRMFEYLDSPTEQDPALAYSAPVVITQHRVAGDIEFHNVSFGYDVTREVLRDISFKVLPGQPAAIVGPSGAGKSSLLRLVPRLADPSRGYVSLNGVPVYNLPLPSLRLQISIVWQEFSVMRGTIWDNLTLGATEISRALVDDAIQICRLDSMIAELPDGYDTPVAEWGSTLSGGQRQRMAIARALIRNTPVLLLDEATSNIDVPTEEALLRDLFFRFQDKTIIYVTHRLATATYADQVCVLDDGTLTALGGPQQVAAISETYRRLLDVASASEGGRRLRIVTGYP